MNVVFEVELGGKGVENPRSRSILDSTSHVRQVLWIDWVSDVLRNFISPAWEVLFTFIWGESVERFVSFLSNAGRVRFVQVTVLGVRAEHFLEGNNSSFMKF